MRKVYLRVCYQTLPMILICSATGLESSAAHCQLRATVLKNQVKYRGCRPILCEHVCKSKRSGLQTSHRSW